MNYVVIVAFLALVFVILFLTKPNIKENYVYINGNLAPEEFEYLWRKNMFRIGFYGICIIAMEYYDVINYLNQVINAK